MRFILFAAIVLFVSGCASSEKAGRFDYKSPQAAVAPEYGYLKVHTQSYPGEVFLVDDEEYPVYTPYKIYRKGGQLVKEVKSSDYAPATVKLAKGEYVIVAEMSAGEINSYTVMVEPGQVLEVDRAMLANVVAKGE